MKEGRTHTTLGKSKTLVSKKGGEEKKNDRKRKSMTDRSYKLYIKKLGIIIG